MIWVAAGVSARVLPGFFTTIDSPRAIFSAGPRAQISQRVGLVGSTWARLPGK
jgi:hypothetical protein